MQMLLTGDTISADEALHYGLVNSVVAPEELMAKAMYIATRIAANAPLAVQAVRNSVRACSGVPEPDALAIEQIFSAQVHQTQDAVEGPLAFIEKRPPVFQGR